MPGERTVQAGELHTVRVVFWNVLMRHLRISEHAGSSRECWWWMPHTRSQQAGCRMYTDSGPPASARSETVTPRAASHLALWGTNTTGRSRCTTDSSAVHGLLPPAKLLAQPHRQPRGSSVPAAHPAAALVLPPWGELVVRLQRAWTARASFKQPACVLGSVVTGVLTVTVLLLVNSLFHFAVSCFVPLEGGWAKL